MRLDKLFIGNFKNLLNAEINFDEKSLTTVLIGRNASAKSNLLEAIVSIFRHLDLNEDPPFKYKLSYLCRGRHIEIDADPQKNKMIQILVDGSPISFSVFSKSPDRRYLPNNVFGYYSGKSRRLEHYFDKHQEKFYRQLLEGQKTPLRPLFFARMVHSQYVLLAFFSFEEAESLNFLREYFGIVGFENATFVLKQPRWFQKKAKGDLFWGARGVVRGFLENLYSLETAAPIRRTERVTLPMGRAKTEERLYLRIEDLNSLHKLASKYDNNVEFFKTLESTYISDLIHELKIRVKKEGVPGSLEFAELSEGEQQLLTVLGLLRFTKEDESLFLLDEPDTHLNPNWKLEYVDLLQRIVGKNETSHVLVVTHDPLLVGGLKKEQVQIFRLQEPEKRVVILPPEKDPIGMGVAGLLTSELFGLPTTLDLETQRKLERKKELAVKKELTLEESQELEKLDEELRSMGFLDTFRDPLYSQFIKAIAEYEQFEKPAMNREEKEEQAKLAKEIVEKLKKGKS
ncbi:MAG: AAA family ATPase [Candidatus Bathyarchaeota archaeon]|nr:AAA family ATPase [Candidatus Bathyarchaeota archaeon]